MPTAQELLDEWEAGEQNGMRPKRMQALRDDLMDATGKHVPRRIPLIKNLITDHPSERAVFTRKLREAADAETDGGEDGADSDSA